MGIILMHPDGSMVGTYFTMDAHDVANKIFVATGERCTCVDEAGEGDDYLFPPESEDGDDEETLAKAEASKAAREKAAKEAEPADEDAEPKKKSGAQQLAEASSKK